MRESEARSVPCSVTSGAGCMERDYEQVRDYSESVRLKWVYEFFDIRRFVQQAGVTRRNLNNGSACLHSTLVQLSLLSRFFSRPSYS